MKAKKDGNLLSKRSFKKLSQIGMEDLLKIILLN